MTQTQEADAEGVTALDWHGYELHSAAPVGALSRSPVRQGALLRVRFGESAGYADLHPWAELGDVPLAGQLALLARGETTELTQASLAFAALDADARAAGRSLWDGRVVPESHFLLPGLGGEGRQALEAALAEGFTHFKVKLGRAPETERALREMCSFLKGTLCADGAAPRLRLDYNETLTPAQFSAQGAGWESLQPFLDFVEDPFPFEAAAWATLSARSGVPFAVDRAASDGIADGFAGVVVHKPARFGPLLPPGVLQRLRERRTVVTSYLDHPVGQLCAAWVAAGLPLTWPREKHGLVSHRIYSRTPFSERLGGSGPRLHLPGGCGLGFDEELATLEWKPLR